MEPEQPASPDRTRPRASAAGSAGQAPAQRRLSDELLVLLEQGGQRIEQRLIEMVARVGAEPRDLRRRLAQRAAVRGHGQGSDQRQQPARCALVGIDRGRRTPDDLVVLLVVQHLQQHAFAVRNRGWRAQCLRVLQIARIALVAHRRRAPLARRSGSPPCAGSPGRDRATGCAAPVPPLAADPRLLRQRPDDLAFASRSNRVVQTHGLTSTAAWRSNAGGAPRAPGHGALARVPAESSARTPSARSLLLGRPPTARPVPYRIPSAAGLSGCASRR